MIVNTDRLVYLATNYSSTLDSLKPDMIDLNTEVQLILPIEQELKRRFGGWVCKASSLTVVAGLDSLESMNGESIEHPSNFIGIRPHLQSVSYPGSGLENAGKVPSLVFETYEPDYNHESSDQDYEQLVSASLVQTYNLAALPLIEPHYIEVIGLNTQ